MSNVNVPLEFTALPVLEDQFRTGCVAKDFLKRGYLFVWETGRFTMENFVGGQKFYPHANRHGISKKLRGSSL